MNANLVSWWGFRLRMPLDYEPEPLTRAESLTFFLLLATLAQLVWFSVLVTTRQDVSRYSLLHDELLVPFLLLGFPIAFGLFVPRAILNALRIGPWLVLARERGNLRRIDVWVALSAVLFFVLALFRFGHRFWLAAAILVLTVGATSVALGFFSTRVDFSKRRSRIELPDWLDDDELDIGQNLAEPDSDRTYTFAVGAKTYEVGINIPAETLNALRTLNRESGGRLFQENPLSVILLDREPSNETGRIDLLRLCRQVLSIGREHALTRYQFANSVLEFVQQAIDYALDEDSTAEFEGGPFGEYGRFALETIHDGVGDCECTAILCSSLLAYLGYDVALIHVSLRDPETGDVSFHAAAGVSVDGLLLSGEAGAEGLDTVKAADGRRYLYGETAVDNTIIAFGGIPPEWKNTMEIGEVVQIPSPVTVPV